MATPTDAGSSNSKEDSSMLDPLLQYVANVPLEEVYNVTHQRQRPIRQEEADSKQPASIDRTGGSASDTGTAELSMASYTAGGGDSDSNGDGDRPDYTTSTIPVQQNSLSSHHQQQPPTTDAVSSMSNNDNSSSNNVQIANYESLMTRHIASLRGLQTSTIPPQVLNNLIQNGGHLHFHHHHHHYHHYHHPVGTSHPLLPMVYSTTDLVVQNAVGDVQYAAAPTRNQPHSDTSAIPMRHDQNMPGDSSPNETSGNHGNDHVDGDHDAATYMQSSNMVLSEQKDDSHQATSSQPKSKQDSENNSRLHPKGLWFEKYEELERHHTKFGHCLIEPNNNPALSQWVKRQRYQYKLGLNDAEEQKRQSYLTPERIKALNKLGFIWDSHRVTWEKRFGELAEYKQINGDCNVPTTYTKNPELGVWLKGQRRQHNLFRVGRKSSITIERIQRLEELGLQWYLRVPKMAAAKEKGGKQSLKVAPSQPKKHCDEG